MSFQSLPSASRLPHESPINAQPRLRVTPDIRFHQPYDRLVKRKTFAELIRKYIKEEQLLRLDNFALFDAVCKRGGFQQVTARSRWEQITLCLQYEKKLWAIQKYYEDVLLKLQPQLSALCQWYPRLLEAQTLQMHLLPSNNLTTTYYLLTGNEYLFAQSHFFSMDQYFNIKTLVLSTADLVRIPWEYAQKYIIMKKWLMFAGQIKSVGLKQARLLGINQKPEIRVAIVGLSLATLMIVDRLSELGITVVVAEKGRKERMRDDYQVVENGVMLLQGGNTKGSYFRALQQSSVLLGEVILPANGMLVLDEQGKPYAEERIRVSEEHFFGIIDQLKGEVMSKKNLYQQVVTRMIRRKLQYQRFLIRWHYDRYMTFNRIKGDSTSVGDLATYESKKFVKHIAQGNSLAVIHSVQKLLSRVRERKNVIFLTNPIERITHPNDTWSIQTRTDNLTVSHLIYADYQTIFKGVLDGNPKLPQLSPDIMGDSLGILQQLTVMKYINCLFRFRQKLLLKQPLKNQTSFSICCAHGFIYFFVLNNSTEIMAILKCYHTSNINYYSQILNILETKCLVKNNRLVNEELYAFEHTFGIRDEKFTESIIRIRQHDRMYLLLPITTTNCPHRTASLIDMANYITANILDQIYPNYQQFDPSLKEQFMPKPEEKIPLKKVASAKEGGEKEKDKEKQNEKEKKQKDKEGSVANKEVKEGAGKEGSMVGSMSSIPNFPSVRSVSEEPSKIKIIPILANQSQGDPNLQITQNELPSMLALNQLQDDWFGVKHPLVKGYQQFIKNRVDTCTKLHQSLTNISLFTLRAPLQLYPGTYLVSLGTPFLNEQQWYTCLLPSPPLPNHLFLLNNFITRRQSISLLNTFTTTIYFQTIIIIDGELYYCVIDQSYPNTKYYHKSLATLIAIFTHKLQALRNQEMGISSRSYTNVKINRCRFQQYPPNQLLPAIIQEEIREELKTLKDCNYDQLLQKKINHTVATVQTQRYMISDPPPYPPMPVPPSPAQIYKEISLYLESLIKIHQLRPFTLLQIFFGVLDQQYIACEIMRKFSNTPLTYFDLQKLDEPLSKEIQEIFSKNIPNEIQSLIIIPQEHIITFHRNFIHPNNRRALERYTYQRVLQIKNFVLTMRHFIVDQNGKKVQFTDHHQIMIEMIKRFVLTYQQQQIISHFQSLINREIEGEQNLAPRIKTYFKMTKKNLPQSIPPHSVNKFNDKCRDLNEEQKMTVHNLLKRKRIRWVDGEVILIAK